MKKMKSLRQIWKISNLQVTLDAGSCSSVGGEANGSAHVRSVVHRAECDPRFRCAVRCGRGGGERRRWRCGRDSGPGCVRRRLAPCPRLLADGPQRRGRWDHRRVARSRPGFPVSDADRRHDVDRPAVVRPPRRPHRPHPHPRPSRPRAATRRAARPERPATRRQRPARRAAIRSCAPHPRRRGVRRRIRGRGAAHRSRPPRRRTR